MRIAVVTESFLPRVNGVTNSVCRVLEHFAATGHQALVVAPRPGPAGYAGHEVSAAAGVALPGYRSFVVGLPTARLQQRLKQFAPDVVYLASPITLGAAGASAARKLDLPCLAVFQTDVAGFAKRYGLRGTDTAIWSWLRHVHNQADRTLVPSSATMRQLAERGFPRLAMWRRGVDSDRFHPRHRCAQLREELAPNGEVLVGYVGRLAGDKRVDLLTHLADLPGVRLVVTGEGPAASRLKTALPNAVFTGFLDGPELSRLYASLDVFVHTGADETFCQAVQEAMASGVPVVAAAAGGPLDLVTPGKTGLFYAPDSVEQFRAAVALLRDEPEMREAFGVEARREVEPRSWRSVGDQLMMHLGEVAGISAEGSSTLAAAGGVLPGVAAGLTAGLPAGLSSGLQSGLQSGLPSGLPSRLSSAGIPTASDEMAA